MDNIYEIGLLLDFYGQLLTKRQYEILDLHYNDDLSLGEIGNQLKISRQGVFDNLKRGRESLQEFEKKLGLVNKFTQQKQKATAVLKLMETLKVDETDESAIKTLEKIKEGVKSIIDAI